MTPTTDSLATLGQIALRRGRPAGGCDRAAARVRRQDGDVAQESEMARYHRGVDDATVTVAVESLRALYAEVGRREARLAELGAKKVTRPTGREHPDLRPVVALFSECHGLFGVAYGPVGREIAHQRRAGDATPLGQVGARIGFADGRLTLLGTCLRSAVSTVISRSAISLLPVRWRVVRGKGLNSPFVDDVEPLVRWDRFADDLDRGVDSGYDDPPRGPVFIHVLAHACSAATSSTISSRVPPGSDEASGQEGRSRAIRDDTSPHWPSGVLPSRTEWLPSSPGLPNSGSVPRRPHDPIGPARPCPRGERSTGRVRWGQPSSFAPSAAAWMVNRCAGSVGSYAVRVLIRSRR